MTEKKKLNLNRAVMRKQPPDERRHNFEEVALGYTLDQAVEEAKRCLSCKLPGCLKACPVCIDIPSFIRALGNGDVEKAARVIRSKNSLPGITGRVCPQEVQCELGCVLHKKGAPIAIGALERFVADSLSGLEARRSPEMPVGGTLVDQKEAGSKKVAIVGSGPCGLTCAADLCLNGYKAIVYEALHVAGGVLAYGIPEFRLPKRILREEVSYVKSLGAEIVLDAVGGKLFSIGELQERYDAVLIAIGSGAPVFLGIPGEELSGIYSANEYLTRINLMRAFEFPLSDTPVLAGKRVAVIGGGNVAMDSARCALRAGADDVYVVYRRSLEEMPANREERINAEMEGVTFLLQSSPTRFIGDEKGWLKAMELVEMELGARDSSGRRRPVRRIGSEHRVEIDMAIVAVGTSPNPLLTRESPGLRLTASGTIEADSRGRTSIEGVWAGGDIVTGAATVISAMGAGKIIASDMDSWLKGVGGSWL